MTDRTQVEQLIEWAKTYNPSHLQSEDDVETKFVLPFFQCLGYAEDYRRGKYPFYDYRPGKGREKLVADHVYFSVPEPVKQNADTALVIIEAKKAQNPNLADAVVQAERYGDCIKPLFIVVTNGQSLKILKRHRHRSNEEVFAIAVQELRDSNTATKVYDQLRFETVKRVKELEIDPLTHAQHVEIMQVLDRNPDIQAQLAKGDFKPSITQEGRQLTVEKPKVAITCTLPVAFKEGNCRIEFSNIMLRGLTCHLSHAEILMDLFIGLDTPPDWETRPFLHKTEQGSFEAHLGQTTVILSEDEACDLCYAVDDVCHRYKELLVETTNALQTWSFRPVSVEDIRGFELLSVKQELWDLMKQFSQEYDYDNGNSDWHIFDSHSWGIRVARKGNHDYAVIWPKFGNSYSPNTEVDLLYVDSITYLELYRDAPDNSIFKNVGPHGIWTATYTKEWMEQQFIPKVLSYYLVTPSLKRTGKIKQAISKLFPVLKPSQNQLNAIMQRTVSDYSEEKRVPLADISEPKQLCLYLHEIQSWFHHYHLFGTSHVPASLLRPYYSTFTELVRYTDPTTLDMHYIRENLGAVRFRTEQEDIDNVSSLATYDDMVKFLDKQVLRINTVDYEDNKCADYLSCAFITILEQGTLHFQQSQLNAAKEALYPLWEQCYYDRHFIEPVILPPT